MRLPGVFRRAFDTVHAPPALSAFILTELASSRRHWHGLLHHALMLRMVGRARVDPSDRRKLILAVLFHDIVYDATRTDNEAASALVAGRWLHGDEAEDIAALILATRHHDLAAADPVTRVLLDADLAILWTPNEALYAFYAVGIRQEYAHVGDAAYRAGRRAVLDRLEQQLRPAIDPTEADRLALNLLRERADLASGRHDLGEGHAAVATSDSA